MAMRRYDFDKKKVRKYIADGQGRGTGADYKPWLTIRDLSSRDRSHQVHHLFSDGEWKCFLTLQMDPNVFDIREQFPLVRCSPWQ